MTYDPASPPANPCPPPPSPSLQSRLFELAVYFLRLGVTAFGGPAAHVAIMERDLVQKRRWLDRTHFLNLFAAVNALPGPSSTELALAIGYLRAGLPGLIVAGIGFILPAFLMMIPLAWVYCAYGALPAAASISRGLDAAVVAVVAIALYRFARTSLTSRFNIAVFVAAALADAGARYLAPTHPIPAPDLLILAAAALAGFLRANRTSPPPAPGPHLPRSPSPLLPLFLPRPFALALAAATPLISLTLLGLLMLKIGATIFGSGYLLLPYLQANFVDSHGWLTQRQLTDAIAAGQFTPGPLLTTASFVGFFVADFDFKLGPAAAILAAAIATIAIFLPAFLYVAILAPILPRLRQSPALAAANAAVVALIFITTITLAHAAIGDIPTLLISLAALILGLTLDANPALLIIAAGIAGWFIYQ
jgi:chromate transporter